MWGRALGAGVSLDEGLKPVTDRFQQALQERQDSCPTFVGLLREVLRQFPPVASALTWMAEGDASSCWDDGEHHLERLMIARRPRGLTLEGLARAYVINCADYIKEQSWFARHGAYRSASSEAFVDTLYRNVDEMSAYMDGLFATLFTWRNHYAMFRFYRDEFLPRAVGGAGGSPRGIEVGPGHGLYFVMGLLAAGDKSSAVGVDISPVSIALTTQLALSYGARQDQMAFIEHDVKTPLPFGDGHFSHAVTGEVLEHVDDPEFQLNELRRVTRRGGKAFVTTAINAAARDHVFLFRSVREVTDMLRRAGWKVERELVLEIPLPEYLRHAGAGSENCAYIVS